MDEAGTCCERAVAVRTEDYAAMMLLCNSSLAIGRTDDATAAMRRAYDAARKRLELNPDNPRALYMGAAALSGLGESEKARGWNRRALEMEADDPSVLYNIACVFAREGLVEEGVAAIRKAVDNGFGHWQWIEDRKSTRLNSSH